MCTSSQLNFIRKATVCLHSFIPICADRKAVGMVINMIAWKNDEELFALMREQLYTAVVGDIMDEMELYHQFLPPQIRPLRDDMVVAGRAMTVLETDCYGKHLEGSKVPNMQKPFGMTLEALDNLKKNEVYICSGSSPTYALVGELMASGPNFWRRQAL